MLSVLTSPKLPWSLAKGTVLICNDKLADRSSRLLGSSSHTRFFKRDCFGCVTERFQKKLHKTPVLSGLRSLIDSTYRL